MKKVTKNLIWNLYIVKKKSQQEIADILYVSQPYIYYLMKKYNISARSKSELTIGRNNPFYGRHHTDKTKKIISKTNEGNQYRKGMKQPSTKGELNPSYQNGYWMIRAQHIKLKKLYCEKCYSKTNFEIHHNPSMDENNCLEWKGKVQTLCRICHMNEHRDKKGRMKRIEEVMLP